MSKSIFILAILCLIVALGGLTSITSAGCSTCHAEENWDPMQKLDEIGNPASQKGSDQVFTAKVARQTNSQFNKDVAQNGNDSNSAASNNALEKPELGVSLNNIGANPNPANPGSPVTINAVLGDLVNMTAYLIVRNPAGVPVGNVTLKKSPGGEYIGTWTAGIEPGIYKTTLVASAQGKSTAFYNVLQINVK